MTALRCLVGTDGYELDVHGSSMLPTLRCRDRVRVVDDRLPEVGELGLFVNHRGDLVAHRVVARLGHRVIFRGDNRTLPDRMICTDQILGRVTGTVHGVIHEPIVPIRGLARLVYYRDALTRPVHVCFRNLRSAANAGR